MTLLRSVVGKLWLTILLLVSFVLFILTIMLLEFFQNYNADVMKNDLTNTANKIATVIEKHPDDKLPLGLEISWEIIDKVNNVVIIKNDNEIYYSPNTAVKKRLSLTKIKNDPNLSQIFKKESNVEKISTLGFDDDEKNAKYTIIGVPLHLPGEEKSAVFIYQSLEVMQETTHETTKFILLVAGVAIILTTIFAFFLSTRPPTTTTPAPPSPATLNTRSAPRPR
jgi:two-component system sensor histidine kinase ResE